MVQLAYAGKDGCSTDQLADKTQVPRAYLSKVIQGLKSCGLVRSQRGIGGGVFIGRPPEAITVLEVVNAVEPLKRITTCPLGIASHGTNLCPLHAKVDSALEAVEQCFGSSTLAAVIASQKPGVMPLCEAAELVS
jgi:Rrf2 family protein